MGYACTAIADSIGPNAARITTLQLRLPRLVLPQFATHRAISKNTRSSRAVPVATLIAEAVADPVIPLFWGENRKGMSATKELPLAERTECEAQWLELRDEAVRAARRLMQIGAHKQIANRLLEPFMWVDVVATATDWSNFFALRCDKHAQPEIQKLAVMMARALRDSKPIRLYPAMWHLPFVTPDELASIDDNVLLKLSVARCARTSYLAFDGKKPSIKADTKLHDDLGGDGHWSPFEHQAAAQYAQHYNRSGNFLGWDQYRQQLPKSVHATFDYASLDQFGERGFIV